MIDKDRIPAELLPMLESKLAGREDQFEIPPPVFDAMQAEMVDYDLAEASLTVKFPVLDEQLNPYGNMQGGMIAAAIDNTIGPLSMLVAPPNFTRHMEVKYRKVISPDLGHFYVTARFVEQKKRQLIFDVVVKDKEGNNLATANSTNWVVE